ncbi:ester cyclase [Chitinophaga arvensicola]|nr:ester cyclase [Chitinophaga arvensicola]
MKTAQYQVYLLSAALLLPAISYSQQKELKTTTMEKNKTMIRELYENAMNQRNLTALSQYIAPTYTGPSGVKGPAGFEVPVRSLIQSFPDIRWTLQEIIAEGNKVMVKWTWHGTHQADFQNIPATHKTIDLTGIAIYECQDGKVTALEIRTDRLGFLTALEVLPADIATAPVQEQVQFIDKFIVPAAGITEFKERVAVNRHFLRKLPGFITDAAYEHPDEQGNLVYVTIAQWESKAAVAKAKEQVQAFYQQEGFDMPGMLKRLGIVMDRGLYSRATE